MVIGKNHHRIIYITQHALFLDLVVEVVDAFSFGEDIGDPVLIFSSKDNLDFSNFGESNELLCSL